MMTEKKSRGDDQSFTTHDARELKPLSRATDIPSQYQQDDLPADRP